MTRARRALTSSALVVAIAGSLAACGFEGLGSGAGAADAGEGRDAVSREDGAPSETPPDAATDADLFLDAEPDGAVSIPASCTEVPAAANKDVTLHVGHDAAKPWKAHCGPAGETYLVLPAGGSRNYSSYLASNCATEVNGAGGPVKTSWTRVRIDPATLVVTTNDYSGAISTGGTHEISGDGTIDFVYTKMPFATGRSCDLGSNKTAARVDLGGTKFRIAADQFIVEGFTPSGTPSTNGQVTTLAPGGLPAGMHPCRPAGTDYYQRDGGKCLQLEYAP